MAWDRTPPAVQDDLKSQNQQIAQLQKQIETLQGRVEQTSQTSRKPPSSDSPFNKPKRQRKKSAGKRGGQKGHRGNGPKWLSPPEGHLIAPGPCACGHGQLVSRPPYHTQQVLALPPIAMDIDPFVLQPGQCQGGGRYRKAQGPRAHQAGDGPSART
jgi:transposase